MTTQGCQKINPIFGSNWAEIWYPEVFGYQNRLAQDPRINKFYDPYRDQAGISNLHQMISLRGRGRGSENSWDLRQLIPDGQKPPGTKFQPNWSQKIDFLAFLRGRGRGSGKFFQMLKIEGTNFSGPKTPEYKFWPDWNQTKKSWFFGISAWSH